MEKLAIETKDLVRDVVEKSGITESELFVLGCSTSEVVGGKIGKQSNREVGTVIVASILEVLNEKGIFLGVQGCEHINRAIVVERPVAVANGFEIVSVVPSMHAGGACSVAAFNLFSDPVEVEFITAKAGIDIGDTAIGMHIKHVAIPIRPENNKLGSAHVTALGSRPKLIGGKRAIYEK